MTTVIKVENLWKQYRYGIISHRTLHKDLQSWWARVRGKEDPNSRIDSHHSTTQPFYFQDATPSPAAQMKEINKKETVNNQG